MSGSLPKQNSSIFFIMRLIAFSAFFIPSSYAVPETIYRSWQFLLFCVAVMFFIAVLLRGKIYLRWVLFCSFFIAYNLLSSAFSGFDAGYETCLFNVARGIGFVSILEYGWSVDKRGYLKAFIGAGLIWCSVNFASYILFRDILGGMQRGALEYGKSYVTSQHWFFFTHDNGTVFFYIPVMASIFYYAERFNKRLFPLAYLFCILSELMYLDLSSTTALIAVGFFLLSCCLSTNGIIRHLFSKLNGCRSFNFGLVLCAAVVVLALFGNFVGVVSNLGKAGTFSYRLSIWDNAIKWFIHAPLLGYGLESTVTAVSKLSFNHCHNLILQLLYSSGLIGFILYVISHLFCLNVACDSKGQFGLNIVYSAIISYFIASIFDWYVYLVLPAILFYLLIPQDGTSINS